MWGMAQVYDLIVAIHIEHSKKLHIAWPSFGFNYPTRHDIETFLNCDVSKYVLRQSYICILCTVRSNYVDIK